MPIASAPIAQAVCSTMRSLYVLVVITQLSERCPSSAEKPTATPTHRTIAPAQSQRLHCERQRFPGSDCQASHSSPSARATRRIASCWRTSSARTLTPIAAAARPQDGRSSVRAIIQSPSVATG